MGSAWRCTTFQVPSSRRKMLVTPDTRWDDAVRIVAEVTGEYGFGPPQTIVDRPSDHEITGFDSYGAKYLFGTAANTVLLVSTGCHLPRAHIRVRDGVRLVREQVRPCRWCDRRR